MIKHLPILISICIYYATAFTNTPAAARDTWYESARFEKLTTIDGLSDNTVTSIIKDSKGFLWIGTLDGLNRYDGYSFTVYRTVEDDSTSISDNAILSLFEDLSGTVWAGTQNGGLNAFNYETNSFKRYMHTEDDQTSLSDNQVKVIYEDSKGILWVGTHRGLNKLDPDTGKFNVWYQDTADNSGFNKYNIGSIHEDNEHMLWIGTGIGLFRFDPETERTWHYPAPTDANGRNNNVFCSDMAIDMEGNIWLASWGGGLQKFNPDTGEFTIFLHDPEDPSSLSNNYVGHFDFDSDGRLWFGTMEGVNVLEPNSRTFTRIKHRYNDDSSLSHDEIWPVYIDDTDTIWVGILKGGLHKLVPSKNIFEYYSYSLSEKHYMHKDGIFTFHEHSDGNILYGSEHSVMSFDPVTKKMSPIRLSPDSLHHPAFLTTTIYEDRAGRIWKTTSGNGIERYDPDNGEYTSYTHESGLISNYVNSLVELPDERFLIGTAEGINICEEESGRIRDISNLFHPFIGDNAFEVLDMCVNTNNDVWCATTKGLLRYDPNTEAITSCYTYINDGSQLPHMRVQCLFIDNNGLVWAGTANGLAVVNPANGIVKRYSTANGLPSTNIKGICGDNTDTVWISTNDGIAQYHSDTDSFKTFNLSHGLPFIEVNDRTIITDRSGYIYVGGTEGFYRFDPDDIVINPVQPRVYITSFKVLGNNDQHVGLITSDRKIRLNHTQNFFSIDFASLDLTSPECNHYSYILEGYDASWINADVNNQTKYFNIMPGVYTFKVRGTNNDGVWSPHTARVTIEITPPYWHTAWFRMLILLLVAGGSAGIHYQRLKSIRKQRKLLKHLVNRKTRELAGSKARLEHLIEMSPDSIFMADSTGTIHLYNHRMSLLMAGKDTSECSMPTLFDIVTDADKTLLARAIDSLQSSGNTVSVQFTINSIGEESIPVEMNASYLDINDKGTIAIIGIIRDISERKRTEKEQMEREVLRSAVETAGAACHELNQPLQAITGYSELLLLQDDDQSPAKEYLKKINQEALRMGDITRKLHGITKYHNKPYGGVDYIMDLNKSSKK